MLSAWSALASDGVKAEVHQAPGMQGDTSLQLDFDFASTAGYAGVRRSLSAELPDDYEISFWMRGRAGQNHLEIKFVDASGENVWWFRRPNYEFTGEWQRVRIKRRQIEFAWGPTQDKVLRRFSSIEFVVAAGAQGGAGTLWFDQLTLKTVMPSTSTAPPAASASSSERGHPAASVLDDDAATSWRGKYRKGRTQMLTLDLQQVREFGGLEIDWEPQLHAREYTVESAVDEGSWVILRKVVAGNGGRDSLLLPESEARWIRLTIADPGHAVGIADIHIRDLEFGASPNAFVRTLAAQSRRGCYPRGFYDEQSYWTVVGVDSDAQEGLISEDGAVESYKGGFSVEPFIQSGDALLSWADVSATQSLVDSYLPIPTVQWRHDPFTLSVTPTAAGSVGDSHLRVTYRISNTTEMPQSLTLALAVRPFQVNPPSQFLNTPGGTSAIRDLSWHDGVVVVNGVEALYSHTAADAFVALPFDVDAACAWLSESAAPEQVHDESGLASGALIYRLEIPAAGYQDVVVDLPQHVAPGRALKPVPTPAVAAVADEWREKLNRVRVTVPEQAQVYADTLRSALAHVLINRDGAGLQPGARSYERSWIRDGAMTSNMLLRLGHEDEAKEFLRWYAEHQFGNGKIPCCVDVRGADPVPENDSSGEFLYLLEEIFRYTGDRDLLTQMWPRVLKAVEYMEMLRASERSELNRQPERRAFYGLMPASISHEAYSARPVHSYWDDFWALLGYESALRMARALGARDQIRQFIAARDEFRADLYRSLQLAMRQHDIDYLPGSAELGDFDPTSTSIALSPGGEQELLPPETLEATFERYWQQFDARRSSTDWDTYTPYELRNVGTFVRLGWRERAHELLEFFMRDRRPAAWNQWAEVVGREPRKPHFVGDMPHGWVESDYARSFLDMFAYEKPDDSLVLMAGIPEEWLRAGNIGIAGLRTAYGQLTYSYSSDGNKRVLQIDKMRLPPGGLSVSLPHRPRSVSIVAGAGNWSGGELRVGRLPFRIEFEE